MERGPLLVDLRRSLLLLAGFFQLAFESDSSHLFLWPLEHSCAKPQNLADLTVPSGRSINADTVQTILFDASPDDPRARAWALTMNINYDDISHCYAHPVSYNNTTGNYMADVRELETCKHGLHFEDREHSLSLMGRFELACARQWLLTTLPQSIAVGLLLGVLLTCWLGGGGNDDDDNDGGIGVPRQLARLIRSAANERRQPNLTSVGQHLDADTTDVDGDDADPRGRPPAATTFVPWLIVQSFACLVMHFNTGQLAQAHGASFRQMLLCTSLRSLIISSCLTRILLFQASPGRNGAWRLQHLGVRNQTYFLWLSLVLVAFQALYSPIALRLFDDWSHLNQWLTITSTLLLVATSLHEPYTRFKLNRSLQTLAFGRDDLECQPAALELWVATSAQSEHLEAAAAAAATATVGDAGAGCNKPGGEQDREETDMAAIVGGEMGPPAGERGRSHGARQKRRQIAFLAPPSPSARVCEFCLLSEPTIYSMNHRRQQHRHPHPQQRQPQPQHQQQQQQSHDDTEQSGRADASADTVVAGRRSDYNVKHDSSSPVDFDAYQPTTMPVSCSSSWPGFSHGWGLWSASSGLQRDGAVSATQLTRHNFGAVYRDLFGWPVRCQLWLLTFAVVFNYFLFIMIPDHKLLHSETFASRIERKESFHHQNEQPQQQQQPAQWRREEVFAYELDTSKLNYTYDNANVTSTGQIHATNKQPADNFSTGLNTIEAPPRIVHLEFAHKRAQRPIPIPHAAEGQTNRSSGISQYFDYRSVNYATKSVDRMRNSYNPIEILWTTAGINGWPVSLLVILLHANSLSSFEATYFKRKRLLSLTKFGAQVLIAEWLSIALIRRQDHLLELAWLNELALLISRFSAALMLYNYFRTMLKLSQRLATDKLVGYVPSMTSALVAYALASLAPILEKLDLVIIPIALVANNSLVYLISRNLGKSFKRCLCPMMFDE